MTLQEENDSLRGLLEAALYYVPSNKTELRALIDNALSQQTEPAPAQDERYQFDGQVLRSETGEYLAEFSGYSQSFIDSLLATRPAQKADEISKSEQQPNAWQSIVLHANELADMVLKGDAPQTAQRTARALLAMLAAPIAQPEQE